MTPTGLTLIASIILGALLTATGTYLIIDNIIIPQGLMFEGITILSLGIITFLLVAIAGAIGKTMITFGDILQHQDAIFKQQIEDSKMSLTSAGSGTFGTFLSNMMENPEVKSKITLDLINPDSLGGINVKQFEGIEGMEMGELEKELATALKKDDFERAEEISKAIKELKGLDESGENEQG
jgi:drug/metabolite transporter superfamily protein YnfA